MRAVIDTNVLLSGLLWRGAPHALIEHVQAGTLAMASSTVLLAELTEVISRAKFDEILARSNTSRARPWPVSCSPTARCRPTIRARARSASTAIFRESVVEEAAVAWLESVGYSAQLSGRVVQRATR